MTTTSDLTEWLRAELAADTEAIQSKSAREWLLTLVKTTLPLYLWARAFFASMVWAINHQAEIHDDDSPAPTVNLSVCGPAMMHSEWQRGDSLQVAALCVWLPVWFYHALWGGGPLWAVGFAGLQAAVLVVEPVRVGVREVIG